MTGHTEKFGRCDCGRHIKRRRTECATCRRIRRHQQRKYHKGERRTHFRRTRQ